MLTLRSGDDPARLLRVLARGKDGTLVISDGARNGFRVEKGKERWNDQGYVGPTSCIRHSARGYETHPGMGHPRYICVFFQNLPCFIDR